MNVERRIATDDPPVADTHDSTNEKNLWLLIQLRWLAVSGQIATIFIVQSWDDVDLPTTSMLIVVGWLTLKNLLSWWRYDHHKRIGQAELLSELIADVLALTAQLYLSGGASNPFINLYLLQIIIGAVLLEGFAIWVLFAICSSLFVALTTFYRPISLPQVHGGNVFSLHIQGMLICFVLASILVIIFITRISQNIRDRDAQIASLRHRKAEDEHIVRLGLLASGAAHELGTPLATISVILGDWQRVRSQISQVDLTEDLHEMQQQIDRCKAIVSGILMSSGNARGEGTLRTTVRSFITDAIDSWREARQPIMLDFDDKFGQDFSIVSDTALRQILFNVLDNAQEALAHRIGVKIERGCDTLLISIEDDGPGFSAEMLSEFGKPYRSTKQRPGGGLGLFLVANVIRNLGGTVEASNRLGGGARLVLALPLSALSMTEGKNA